MITLTDLKKIRSILEGNFDLSLNYNSMRTVLGTSEDNLIKYPYTGSTRSEALEALALYRKFDTLVEELEIEKKKRSNATLSIGLSEPSVL